LIVLQATPDSDLGRETGVSNKFAKKVVQELLSEGGMKDPRDAEQNRRFGPGVRTLDEVDAATLIQLLIARRTITNPT
jgi:hypothetical protein